MLDTERYWQEEWAARVLRWARGKTRTAQEAEDLAQTVLLEWLRAVRAQEERGVCVAEPEHLLWRIARLVQVAATGDVLSLRAAVGEAVRRGNAGGIRRTAG